MVKSLGTIVKLSVVTAALALLAGCASHGSVDGDLASQLAEIRATANSAMQNADAALSTAEAAQAAAEDNSEKIDRMFERSMYK
ncbi:MAG: hypothetical protein KGY57_03110 [Gammaproteobacteria bacterium]|nr:hypothetical protein [Gammaproteobacteria bacterium]